MSESGRMTFLWSRCRCQAVVYFPASVSLLEPFGSRTDVHVVATSGEKCILSVPPSLQLGVDQEVHLHVSPERLHLFRPDGAALRVGL